MTTKAIKTSLADSPITITAFDLNLQGSLTSTDTVKIHESIEGQSLGLGDLGVIAGNNLVVGNSELQRINCTAGLVLGGAKAGNINVARVEAASSVSISPIVSLVAKANGSKISFTGDGSTFHALAGQADSGVTLQTSVIQSTHFGVFFDGDMHDASSSAEVRMGHGLTLSAKTLLVLENTMGSMPREGVLTLRSGQGVEIKGDLVSEAGNKACLNPNPGIRPA